MSKEPLGCVNLNFYDKAKEISKIITKKVRSSVTISHIFHLSECHY